MVAYPTTPPDLWHIICSEFVPRGNNFMNPAITKKIVAAAAVLTTTAAIVTGSAGTGSAGSGSAGSGVAAVPVLQAFGISGDGTLMATFTTARPDVLNWVKLITGLSCDTALVGIDHRVQDGLLYGVGNCGGIYQIIPPNDPSGDVVVKKVSQLTVPLYGTNFGVDFNPAADRLRVVSDNAQNLRHNLATHTTVEDGSLTTPPDPGPARGVTAVAYTNNDLNPATATTLFGINTITDQVVIQSPANNGTLAPTGSLGIDVGPNAGFDIYSDLTNGKTTSATAFASLTPVGGRTGLYTIDLLTGAATKVNDYPIGLTDVAVVLDPS
jgi:hypothetical protein